MPRLVRSPIKLLKVVLCFIVCFVLFSKTKELFPDSSAVEENGSPTDTQVPLDQSRSISAPSPPIDCSRSKRLGVPRYVDEMCRQQKDRTSCQNLTCERLLLPTADDGSVYRAAREFMTNNTRRKVEPEEFVRMTKNCTSFLLERGFAEKMSVDEDFPIAFNILAHGNVEQVERLIHALYRRRNRFCVHFDLKSTPGSQEALEAIGRCLPNVVSASKRLQIFWGDFSRLEADMICMRDHVESGGKDWKYLINAAGQAFPLRSIKEMVEILRLYNGANDVEGLSGERVLRHRFEFKFEVNKEGIIAMKEPNVRHPDPPHELDIVRGSSYGVFSRRFVEFMLTDRKSKDLLEWSRETFSPDELYFSTLHHTFGNPQVHSPGGYSGIPDDKPWMAVYANWGTEPCSGYGRHGICVFGIEDLPRLLKHKEFFVNKLLADFEPMALECLRAWIDYKDTCTGTDLLDMDFYTSLPFIKKTS